MTVPPSLTRRKLDKRLALYLAAAALLAAYLWLGLSIARDRRDEIDLSARIDEAVAALASTNDLTSGQDALPAQLDDAKAELAAAKAAYPRRPDNNDALESVLAAARERSVAVLTLESAGANDDGPADLRFDIEATGSLPHLLAFIEALELGPGLRQVTLVGLQQQDGVFLLDTQLVVHARPADSGGEPAPEATDG